MPVAQDNGKIHFLTGAVNIAFCINERIEPRAVGAFSANFKPRGIYFGIVEGQVIEIIGRFGDDSGFEAREELVLAGSNVLIRTSGGQRMTYRRCIAARPTG